MTSLRTLHLAVAAAMAAGAMWPAAGVAAQPPAATNEARLRAHEAALGSKRLTPPFRSPVFVGW